MGFLGKMLGKGGKNSFFGVKKLRVIETAFFYFLKGAAISFRRFTKKH